MLPVCYPSSPSSTTGLPEAVAYTLSSVSGLTRWVDYIPIKLVSGQIGANENTTNNNGGFVAMRLLGSSTGLNAWRDYIPVYVDNSATEAWVTSATGYIPYANSVGSSTQYMIEGMNLGVKASWSGFTMFSNVCYQMTLFLRYSGAGAWTQDQGTVTATVGTDEFRASISDSGLGLPTGTYTVYNPTGANISFGTFSSPGTHSGGYSTATSFTFTYTSGMLALFVKGSLTCTGFADALKVILPGHTTSWAAGNVWNSDYLTFRAALGQGVMRMMDWNAVNGSVETDWADRTVNNKVSLRGSINPGAIPYELQIDLANRLSTDLWMCIPARASSTYVSALTTLVGSTLNSGQRLWIEHGNEIWNYSGGFADGTNWTDYLDFTKYTATADYATNTFTLAGHGLVAGQPIRCFDTKENASSYNISGGTLPHLNMTLGNQAKVDYIDANSFRLFYSDGVTPISIGSSQVNLLYCKEVEAGKSTGFSTNYGEQCIRNWDIIDPILGAGSYNRIVARQAANTTTLTQTLAVPGVSTRATYISCAPYIYSFFWAGKIAIATGSFTPSVWVSAAKTMHVSVYAAGATPTDAEIIAGTGAINHQTVSASTGAGSWQAATAVTGLSNGTSYKVYFLVVDTKKNWVSSQTLVASATPSDAFFYDTNANQAERDRAGSDTTSIAYATAFIAAGGGIPLFCYEGGYHNYPDSGITEVGTWLNGTYQESDEFAEVILDNLYRLASIGVKGHVYYCESAGGNTFSIANSVTDVTDKRYAALAALGGRVAVQPALSVSDTTPTAIPSLPTLPYTIETLPTETGRTYAIVGGNQSGNYDLSGNDLRMTAATGIDWGTPVSNVVYLEAFRGALSDQFTSTFTTGSAWYEGDAKYAWSTVTDTDTAAITPIVGTAITLTSGTAAVAGGGLWDLQTNSYYLNGSTAVATNIPQSGTPMLFAMVMDKDNHVANFTVIAGFGSTPYLQFTTDGSALYGKIYTGSVAHSVSYGALSSQSGAHVYWIYMDGAGSPTMYVGRDQVDTGNVACPTSSGQTFGKGLQIGNTSGMLAKIGSVQVVSRAGMTRADAKAIVAKMQAHHGIP